MRSLDTCRNPYANKSRPADSVDGIVTSFTELVHAKFKFGSVTQ